MERGRRAGWTVRPRSQHDSAHGASAHGSSAILRVTTLDVSPAPLSASHVLTSSKIPSSTTLTGSVVRDGFLAFPTGSAPQTELAVTHSKQTTGTFPTGARTAFRRTTISTPQTQELARVKQPARHGGPARRGVLNRHVTHGFITFLTETASQTEMAVTYRKQTTAHSLTETRIAHYRLAAQLSNSHSDPVFPARILPSIELIEGGKL
jgi:hypothetical protein